MTQLRSNNKRGDYDHKAGIEVKFLHPDKNDVTIVYNGLLAKSGATQVYLHTGFGDRWDNVYDHRMEPTPYGWEKTIQMERNDLSLASKTVPTTGIIITAKTGHLPCLDNTLY